jgi:hypothetical protein
MKYIQLIILFLLGVYTQNGIYAQSSITWNQVLGETQSAFYDSVASNDGLYVINTHETKLLSAQLNDTSSIAQVRVKLGTINGGSDILVQTFSFSGQQVNELVWFQRTGIICRFGLGEFVNLTQSYLTLEALSATGAVLGAYSGLLY